MTSCIATIVSANYLAYARVLSESVARHLPDWDFKVLLVDRKTVEICDAVRQSSLNVTFAEDLALDDFEALAFKYDLVELNTALKPTFLKRLFAKSYQRVAYIDPDICLFDGLVPVQKALDQYEVVLTPHALAPIMDGQRPSDIDFLRNGTLNLGFIALKYGKESHALLDWWEERCLSYGFNDLGFGTFVDQKWMELAPSYFDAVHILRHPGCNAAYWNMHERKVEIRQSVYMANGQPLSFFHFSGVRANQPTSISKHQTRHKLVPGDALASLYQTYCDSLIRLGHTHFSQISYTFGHFDDGQPISQSVRRASCFAYSDGKPFHKSGPLYNALLKSGLIEKASATNNQIHTTLNFDQHGRRALFINRAIRMAARVFGRENIFLLLKYAAFLSRESNYTRVLLSKPFILEHNQTRR